MLDVDPEHHDVKLRVPGKGCGGVLVNKWINVSDIKPVVDTHDGKLLLTL